MRSRGKIWRILILILLAVLLLFLICWIRVSRKGGLETPNLPSEWEDGESVFLPNDLLEPKDPENENLAGMLQEQAAGVMVRILAGNRLGSGVIWEMNETSTIILTAAHVLEDYEEIEITLAEGSVLSMDDDEEAGKQWRVVLSSTTDLGFLILPTEQIPEDAVSLCRYAAVDKGAFDGLQSGDIILVMGSGEEVAGSAYEGSLRDSWIYMKDYSQYMMLAHTYAKPGMSGGGVFDMYGHFVGILSGADESGNLAIVPLSVILTEASNL